MDRQYIDDHHVVARYLADQLSDADREAFEAYYLEHPEMVRELEATARFKAGLGSLEQSGELSSLITARPWHRQWQVAAAAALVVAVGTALFVSRDGPDSDVMLAGSLSSLQHDGAPVTLFQSYRVFSGRDGGTVDASFALPAIGQAIELRIDPARPDRDQVSPGPYQVSLVALAAYGKERVVTAVSGLGLAEDRTVPIYLGGPGLAAGTYLLVVTDEKEPDVPITYSLRIEPAR